MATNQDPNLDEYTTEELDAQAADPMCECEVDWRCPLHAGLPTFLELRYSEDDLDPRERSGWAGL